MSIEMVMNLDSVIGEEMRVLINRHFVMGISDAMLDVVEEDAEQCISIQGVYVYESI